MNHSKIVDVRPATCSYCSAPVRMRYPGGDPENGPARLSCGKPWCDDARDSIARARRYSMADGTTLDELHDEALEEYQYDLDLERRYPAEWLA